MHLNITFNINARNFAYFESAALSVYVFVYIKWTSILSLRVLALTIVRGSGVSRCNELDPVLQHSHQFL